MGMGRESLSVEMSAALKERVLDQALEQGISMSDVVVRMVCQGFGMTPEEGLPPKGRPGRKPKGIDLRKKAKKRKEERNG